MDNPPLLLLVKELTNTGVNQKGSDVFYVRTYEEGYEDLWEQVQHSVFPEKKRHFDRKYIDNDTTCFLGDHFFFAFKKSTDQVAGIIAAEVIRVGDRFVPNLDYLGVVESERGQGAGNLLVRHVERRFTEDGFSRATLRTPDIPGREEAISLYKDRGWEIVEQAPAEEIYGVQEKYAERPDPLLERVQVTGEH